MVKTAHDFLAHYDAMILALSALVYTLTCFEFEVTWVVGYFSSLPDSRKTFAWELLTRFVSAVCSSDHFFLFNPHALQWSNILG